MSDGIPRASEYGAAQDGEQWWATDPIISPPPIERQLPWEMDWGKPRSRWQRLKSWADGRWWAFRFWLFGIFTAAADRSLGLPKSPARDCGPFADLVPPADMGMDPAPPPPAPQAPDAFGGWCEFKAEAQLAASICETFDLEWQPVWDCLGRLPAAQRLLLETPQGWGMVADWVVAELTRLPRLIFLKPTIN